MREFISNALEKHAVKRAALESEYDMPFSGIVADHEQRSRDAKKALTDKRAEDVGRKRRVTTATDKIASWMGTPGNIGKVKGIVVEKKRAEEAKETLRKMQALIAGRQEREELERAQEARRKAEATRDSTAAAKMKALIASNLDDDDSTASIVAGSTPPLKKQQGRPPKARAGAGGMETDETIIAAIPSKRKGRSAKASADEGSADDLPIEARTPAKKKSRK